MGGVCIMYNKSDGKAHIARTHTRLKTFGLAEILHMTCLQKYWVATHPIWHNVYKVNINSLRPHHCSWMGSDKNLQTPLH